MTHPKDHQRSTYYLGLPFRFAVPINLIFLLLHWLVSQTLFVYTRALFDSGSEDNRGFVHSPDEMWPREVYEVGYSLLAAILAIALGSILAMFSWLDDLRPLPGDMPIVGTNSALIAAACQSYPTSSESKDIVLRPLQWGVVRIHNGISHCGFTDDEDRVVPLSDGEIVASDHIIWKNRRQNKWRVEQEEDLRKDEELRPLRGVQNTDS